MTLCSDEWMTKKKAIAAPEASGNRDFLTPPPHTAPEKACWNLYDDSIFSYI